MLDQKQKFPQLAEPEPEIREEPPKQEEVFKMPKKGNITEQISYDTSPEKIKPVKPKKKKNCSPELLEHLKKAREKSLATRKKNKELKAQAKRNLKAKEKEEVQRLKMNIQEPQENTNELLKEEPEKKREIKMDENRRIIEDVSSEKPKEYKNTNQSSYQEIDYEKIIMGVSKNLINQMEDEILPEPEPVSQPQQMEKHLRATPQFTPEHPKQYEEYVRNQERDRAKEYYEKIYNDRFNKAVAHNIVGRSPAVPRLNNKPYSDDIWEKCFRQ